MQFIHKSNSRCRGRWGARWWQFLTPECHCSNGVPGGSSGRWGQRLLREETAELRGRNEGKLAEERAAAAPAINQGNLLLGREQLPERPQDGSGGCPGLGDAAGGSLLSPDPSAAVGAGPEPGQPREPQLQGGHSPGTEILARGSSGAAGAKL